ncbi:pyruvate ferredoxin oxidoreductase [Bordetella genomosp. 1]|uniref:Pyruvate ferredoxin oxidoreductase n=1 Tax=Bordetella genomosp. 1 TaxID=1395607 RepID=A0A261STQ1_9BORD|nr:indolepyruvate ferredoxin oxidoreductase family protein [Bordetella genomosp. 1]OZI40769.1 pyruvate ferredoxin oxidoreductase [Bordetella genomosp. 1]
MDGTPAVEPHLDTDYQLSDNLTREAGRIFLTGTQALVRMVLAQRRADAARGLNTAGFVSGYRGSPLGGVDMAMWKAQKALDAHQVTFMPGINEDLAATAVMGTQQAGMRDDRKVDGVFALWYGKGPGVDRAGDALHHGNAAGASRHGGVLLVVGDDHTAVSSSIPHASETSLIGWQIPIVHPASIDEYESFALWGWALSRYSGSWVALKATSESVETGQSYVAAPPPRFDMPDDGEAAEREYNARDFLSLAVETRMHRRLAAVRAFARTHSLDRLIAPAPQARVGIVTAGKVTLDTLEALQRLGLDIQSPQSPVRVYKPGLVWPMDRERLLAFAQGLSHILVIEEKAGVMEPQIKDMLFNLPERPTVCGKTGLDGEPLITAAGQLRPSQLAGPMGAWLGRTLGLHTDLSGGASACPQPLSNEADGMRRRPYFCSGCPHSTSTKVPKGSQALSGVGCHYMAAWMDRDTGGLTQMGGEGVDWIGLSRYIDTPHVFQNMGEGTYYHSGYLAIRQAVAAGTHITYKILFNDAVAMTGGQPVDGPISVPQICQQLRGENVARIVVTSDEPEKYRGVDLAGVPVHHRRELDRLQRELREVPGVTVLIHDQTCAAEKRRRRKKNQFPDPARRMLINSAVCEGCGDCGVQSNCLSVVPLETPYGRKRAIDQSSCNKDFSCAEGFCPSFVSVMGGAPKKSAAPKPDMDRLAARIAALPLPQVPELDAPYRLLVAGMGGTGVITIGALVSMAAHLQGLSASVLDLTGLAQKGGTVVSHLRLAPAHAAPGPVRLDWQQADAAILCDPLAATAPDSLGALANGRTRVTVNTYVAPVSDFTRNPDAPLNAQALLAKIEHAAGRSQTAAIDAHAAALALFGDSILSNIFMLGYAWQRGDVPLTLAALTRAIELNGVAVAANRKAFDAGRLAAHEPDALAGLLAPAAQVIKLHIPETFEQVVARRERDLTAYQNAAYATEYRKLVDAVAARERELAPEARSLRLATAVARGLFKFMAYKDEYEVARLYTDPAFQAQLDAQFEGDYSLRFHMAPPLLARKDPHTGVPRKMTLGPRTRTLLRWMAHGKRLRGTWADPFGRTAERRAERALIGEYRELVGRLLKNLRADNIGEAATIAGLAESVRGYGHIKEAAIARFRTERDTLLASFESPGFAAVSVRRSA